MASVTELVPVVGVAEACEAVGVARASFYRQARRRRALSAPLPPPSPRHEGAAGERSELSVPDASARVDRVHPRALSPTERAAVLDVLHSERFRDAAPAAVYATLLDEGTYLASERTMYRLLAAAGETRPRRDQLVHPAYAKPELLALVTAAESTSLRARNWDLENELAQELLTSEGGRLHGPAVAHR